jgi:hypothetical protein
MSYLAPNSSSLDFTHMYNVQDTYPGKCETVPIINNSIIGVLRKHGGFTKYIDLIKISGMLDKWNQPDWFVGTLFVVPDKYLADWDPNTLDVGTALRLVQYNATPVAITYCNLLKTSKFYYLQTKYYSAKMMIDNLKDPTHINTYTCVRKHDQLDASVSPRNGSIIITNGIMDPYYSS